MRLEGKRAFVTGAASGIGAATVERLTAEGARVVGADIAEAPGVARCDVTDPSSVATAIDAAVEHLGGLDICANVAGVNFMAAFDDVTLEFLNKHLSVNLIGPLLVTQAALAHLRESKGNVVTVASISALQGQPYNSAYCASKGAVLLLMRSLAVEAAADGVRVNCVCPGGVDTPMSAGATSTLGPDVSFDHFVRMTGVMPGFMPPADIASAIAYLASDDAASVTGSALVVDRGTIW